ncbi:MAG: hypothetical protein LC799_24660, partial [Actinobacteria bacterium]|nr:hypothetical protein [Actinomycetota bacterium]
RHCTEHAVVIDALVIPEVLLFWRAVLGYQPRADTPEEELNDPHYRWPFFYSQQMDAPRPQRNRIHIDVFVPHVQAEASVEAAIAAGGHVISDKPPSAWTLADAEAKRGLRVRRLDGQ